MAKIRLPYTTLIILVLLVISTAPHPTHSYFNQYRTLLSLSHSLLTRVANMRAERGDIAGSKRMKLISEKLERGLGLGFVAMAWSVGWDYVKNYGWKEMDHRELYGAISDLNELMRCLSELRRVDSEVGRANWVRQNYGQVLGVSKRMLVRLPHVFRQSGALREVLEMVEKEVMDGGLLRDCLEVGTNDLKGLIEVLKDLVLHYYPSTPYDHDL